MTGSKGDDREQERWQEANERTGRKGRGQKGREEGKDRNERCIHYVYIMYKVASGILVQLYISCTVRSALNYTPSEDRKVFNL